MVLVARHAHGTNKRQTVTASTQPPAAPAPHPDGTPVVSESHEGQPVAEWVVTAAVACSAVIAAFGYTSLGILILAVTTLSLGTLRLSMRERSPWKVRSIGFDSCICLGLGVGLLLTYVSILWLF
ncbi:hypothetical protein KIM372_09410 [Bombiscardovia nodaiensis]|uniref:Rod shape-determining protein RodA n=1 Tax=Bombiscardovia nodaiensis TaxID=2932181 RepID=A0ABN6SC04_9BIFI|nr:hypothetical protein KIM372_09410 [Bombiscardovia nodaiensis]